MKKQEINPKGIKKKKWNINSPESKSPLVKPEANNAKSHFPIKVSEPENNHKHRSIAKKAYFIWQEKGSSSSGNDLQNWLQAEAAILVQHRYNSGAAKK